MLARCRSDLPGRLTLLFSMVFIAHWIWTVRDNYWAMSGRPVQQAGIVVRSDGLMSLAGRKNGCQVVPFSPPLPLCPASARPPSLVHLDWTKGSIVQLVHRTVHFA